MNQFEVIMPKMGESIEEATITKWFVKAGDPVKEDDILLEIATDKVDSEIPSPVEGIVKKVLYQQDEIVPVGSVIAIIELASAGSSPADDMAKPEETESGTSDEIVKPEETESGTSDEIVENEEKVTETLTAAVTSESSKESIDSESSDRYYSPLVRKIAREEKVSLQELEAIKGSGHDGRVQKNDLLAYLKSREPVSAPSTELSDSEKPALDRPGHTEEVSAKPAPQVSINTGDVIVQMDRMRKIIADHMINSQQVSANVTNIIEVDVTDIVNWRNRIKDNFEKNEGQKITYLPIFLESVIKGIKDFPMINSSVDGDKIITKKRINLGIAVALENFNLIVPVIKNADNLSLTGLTKELNRLANAARNSQLKPDEIQDGTFTITNFGSFKNAIGTPIINQPQVAILAIGTIEKKPAVLETSQGDVIAIRHKMFLSLTYDHRIIDGSLGGSFLRKVGDYIESFDITTTI